MSDNQNVPAPLDSSEDYSQYLLSTRGEVAYVLRGLITQGELAAAYFNQGRDFILTTLLDVNAERGILIFDYGSNNEMNDKLLQSERIIFVIIQNGIRIQFVTGQARKTQYGGGDAFVTAIPKQLMRLQRREFYRVTIPFGSPLECNIPGHDSGNSSLEVHNICVGGVAMTASQQFRDSKVMDKHHNCRIHLPDLGEVLIDLEVRHVTPISQRRETPATRIGCRFTNIMPVTQAMLQRYQVKVEREKRAMLEE